MNAIDKKIMWNDIKPAEYSRKYLVMKRLSLVGLCEHTLNSSIKRLDFVALAHIIQPGPPSSQLRARQ